MKRILTICLIAIFTSCTHLSSVSLTSIPKRRANKIKVERYKFIFLGFNFNNNFVNQMVKELRSKCPKGSVKGILTKDESIVYFPLIAHARQITAEGYCMSKGKK